jgi:drug/metabolite transporter (DMT)-like permease
MASGNPSTWQTLVATSLAMTAFAANSILSRLALGPSHIDAAGFTAIRLVSGAATLFVLARLSGRRRTRQSRGNWISGVMLLAYAIMFSFAYVRLSVGSGALILFAFVQATMIAWGLVRGERPKSIQWVGLAVAVGGLVYLVLPGLSAPSTTGSLMMAIAGVAWGTYSLRGRGPADPLVSTTDNFVRAAPLALIVAFVFFKTINLSTRGAVLAIASGSIASGIGYVVWYAALRGLTATRAASVQLTVPVIAAVGGIVILREAISLRIAISAALILGGVALTLVGRENAT